MQSYIREFNGKNQFWTPSNSGLLSKSEAESTYLKKSDLSDMNNIQYEKIQYFGGPGYFLLQNIPVYFMQNRGTATSNSWTIGLGVPTKITNTFKIVRVKFYAYFLTTDSGSKNYWLEDLCCSLTDDAREPMKGTIHKGFPIAGDKNVTTNHRAYGYFEFNQIIYGNPKYLYLHFFYQTGQSVDYYKGNKIYVVYEKDSGLNLTVEYFGFKN